MSRNTPSVIIALLMAVSTAFTQTTTFYVDASRPDDSGNGQSWATAKQTIQAAIDITHAGDTVIVTNGIYESGGQVVPGQTLLNRVCVTNDIILKSVNGPDVTIIKGLHGATHARGVFMPSGILAGFTVTGGSITGLSTNYDDWRGGGIFGGDALVITNCIITANSSDEGGGVYKGRLSYCLVTGNGSSDYGGGAAYSHLTSCIVSNNTAAGGGGGAVRSTLTNCIITANHATDDGGGADECTLTLCSVSNNVAGDYGGGLNDSTATDSLITDNTGDYGGGAYGSILRDCTISYNKSTDNGGGAYHSKLSRCIISQNNAADDGGGISSGSASNCLIIANAATNSGGGSAHADLYNCTVVNNTAGGNGGGIYTSDSNDKTVNSIAWYNTATGAGNDIYNSAGWSGTSKPLNSCASSGLQHWVNGCLSIDPQFTDPANGDFTLSPSSPCIDHGNNTYAALPRDLDDNNRIQQTTVDMGAYESATAFVSAGTTYYVDASRPDDSGDGLSWATAKKTIQAAADLAIVEGDTVLVIDGIYNLGGKPAPGSMLTNRVCVYGPVTVKSVNGPDVTIIEGAPGSNGSNDVDAVRCAYIDNGATLDGFTLTNGYTIATFANEDGTGGGLWGGTNTVATNCIISGCHARNSAGAARLWYGAALHNCQLIGNRAGGSGGATFRGVLTDCTISHNYAREQGGGTVGSILNRCIISHNQSGIGGGGANGGRLSNCLLVGNSSYYGGGVQYAELFNCTVAGNSATKYGGGTHNCNNINCIVWGNTAGTQGNDIFVGSGSYRNTCASDGVTHGTNGCITNNPQFINAAIGDFHLWNTSPCINRGDNADAPLPYDLDGTNRILEGTVDMGAYETVAAPDEKQPNDFDGDGKSDLAILDQSTGRWYIQTVDGTPVATNINWGWPGAVAVPGDYDGDGIGDLAVFGQHDNGHWFIRKASGPIIAWNVDWGWRGAIPVSGDYDGDGKADLAVFDNQTGNWFIRKVSGPIIAWNANWGWRGAIPVSGDFDGDGKADLAVFNNQTGHWFIRKASGPIIVWNAYWGWQGAIPVSGDFDGDGKSDLAVFNNQTGNWFIRKASGPIIAWNTNWGWQGAIPVSGDFDGDGKADLAVINQNTGHGFIRKVSGPIIAWDIKWGKPGGQPIGK